MYSLIGEMEMFFNFNVREELSSLNKEGLENLYWEGRRGYGYFQLGVLEKVERNRWFMTGLEG